MAVLFQALTEKDLSLDYSNPGKDPLSGFGHIAHSLKGWILYFLELAKFKGTHSFGRIQIRKDSLSLLLETAITQEFLLSDIFFFSFLR